MHFLQAINSDLSVLIVCNKTGGTIKGDIKKKLPVEGLQFEVCNENLLCSLWCTNLTLNYSGAIVIMFTAYFKVIL